MSATVVKLGGSLARGGHLPDCLARLAGWPGGVVVVPGGGAFADQVRMAQHDFGFDDDTAHGMALLAMQQMALLINGIAPGYAIGQSLAEVRRLSAAGRHVVWSPLRAELDAAAVPASWEISADSLAAWLAGALAASQLVVVKAAAVADGVELGQLAQAGIVDAAFAGMAAAAGCKVTVLEVGRLAAWLEGGRRVGG